jgi:phage shock protein A
MAVKPNVKEAENAVRDLKNWIAVFAQEYDLPDEAVKKLQEKVDELASKIAGVKCA